ncbi:carbonic anhydrase [Capillimicrobium parvum]|uniref:Carbonic anhydrase n=1 Tax=Capillimicrobium parvum TaxID=2884022 RepID=A0A9E7BZG0_9ACTN|nr:carbonic anhydrase [Capillimicrobium parvum]UGS34363.1 Carbonic anhydrase 2 [Capillimicrobium parvum]
MAPSDGTLSRRGFIGGVGAAAAVGAGLGGLGGLAVPAYAGAANEEPSTPDGALAALIEGNRRYRTGRWTRRDYSPVGEERASKQAPFAAILACADSRVSPPLIFDVERGNLFAAHVAGNSIDDGSAGSLEYAVAVLSVPLVMVLGHTDCGAVKSAMDVVSGKASFPSETFGSIGAVVDPVVPAVQSVPEPERSLDHCIVANARVQAHALSIRGPVLPPAIRSGALRIVSAVYQIASGRVVLV